MNIFHVHLFRSGISVIGGDQFFLVTLPLLQKNTPIKIYFNVSLLLLLLIKFLLEHLVHFFAIILLVHFHACVDLFIAHWLVLLLIFLVVNIAVLFVNLLIFLAHIVHHWFLHNILINYLVRVHLLSIHLPFVHHVVFLHLICHRTTHDAIWSLTLWAIIEEVDYFVLGKEYFNYSLALFLSKIILTIISRVTNIWRRIKSGNIKLSTLLTILFGLILIFLTLLHDLVNSLLEVVFQLGFRLNLLFKLGSCVFVLLSDVVDHFLKLVDDSFVSQDFLFLTFGLDLWLIN